MAYRILACDGGGIRGVLSAVILDRIETARPGFLASIDMFAGTSTGGLLAMGLAKGMKPKDIIKFYEQYGPDIFHKHPVTDIVRAAKLLTPTFNSEPREKACQAVFGADKLGDFKKDVVVTAFNLNGRGPVLGDPSGKIYDSWRPKIFINLARSAMSGDVSDSNELAWEVAMRTSAAPTYFAPADGYVDGGVYANNPSMVALVQALDSRNKIQHKLDEIAMLSVSTGTVLNRIEGSPAWGEIPWLSHVVDLMMDAGMMATTFEAAQMLRDRYQRINPVLETKVDMADATKIEYLKQIGQSVDIGPTLDFIDKQWASLPAGAQQAPVVRKPRNNAVAYVAAGPGMG